MQKPPRYIPEWPFPTYVFIPGVNTHPAKPGGHMHGKPEPIADKIDLIHPEENSYFKYALDLYNHQYFWESHVYFEALWNAHGRVNPVADFLKGLIKLGAAGVKLTIEQKAAALGHFARAQELFQSVKESQGDQFLGFNLTQIIQDLDTPGQCFPLYPSWKSN